MDSWPKRLEVSKHGMQTESCEGIGQVRKDMRYSKLLGKKNQHDWGKIEH